jgi:hypothetical protein
VLREMLIGAARVVLSRGLAADAARSKYRQGSGMLR